jgi:hypothetical protein
MVQTTLMAQSTIHCTLEILAGAVEHLDILGGQPLIVEFGAGLESIPSCIRRQLFFQNGRAISSIFLSNRMALSLSRGYTMDEPFCQTP